MKKFFRHRSGAPTEKPDYRQTKIPVFFEVMVINNPETTTACKAEKRTPVDSQQKLQKDRQSRGGSNFLPAEHAVYPGWNPKEKSGAFLPNSYSYRINMNLNVGYYRQ